MGIGGSRKRNSSTMSSATSFYNFKPLDKKGQELPLDKYKGKVVLVVNTASKCGSTPQYAGLESLYYKIKQSHPDDFIILGFPCNQFAGQEPGTDDGADPLYQWLKDEQPGFMGLKRIKWNFEKFLIGRDGQVKGRWASLTKPDALERPILDELSKKPSEPAAPSQTTSADAPASAEAPASTEQKL